MNEEVKKAIEQFANELKEKTVTRDDLKAMEDRFNEIKGKIEALPSFDDVKGLQDALKEQGEALAMIKSSGAHAGGQSVLDEIKNFVTNKENVAKVKARQSVHGEFEMKADATTMFTSNATQAIQAWNTEIDRTIHAVREEPNALYARFVKGATSSPYIKWVNRVAGNGGAAWTPEGGAKPPMDWSYSTETSEAKKIAVSAKVSTEMLEDAEFVRAEIDRLLRNDLMTKINTSVLTGTGTGNEILGIASVAKKYTITNLNGKVEAPNHADAIRAAALQLRLGNFIPDTLAINPSDKALIDLTKDTNGRYLSDELRVLLAGLQVVETANIPAGKFLLADSSVWMLRPYKAIRLEYGYVNDDFTKNLVTIICEARMHSYIATPDKDGLIYEDFATIEGKIKTVAA